MNIDQHCVLKNLWIAERYKYLFQSRCADRPDTTCVICFPDDLRNFRGDIFPFLRRSLCNQGSRQNASCEQNSLGPRNVCPRRYQYTERTIQPRSAAPSWRRLRSSTERLGRSSHRPQSSPREQRSVRGPLFRDTFRDRDRRMRLCTEFVAGAWPPVSTPILRFQPCHAFVQAHTTSSPRRRRLPPLSILKVFPKLGAYPRKSLSTSDSCMVLFFQPQLRCLGIVCIILRHRSQIE
jgi:hypothetical protein